MVNNAVLVGRLATDPEMRYTQNGVAVTNFRLAVNRVPRRDSDEEPGADFIDIVTWRQTAEFCGNYLTKGALVSVEGRIQVRNWQTQDGQPRRSVEIVAQRVQALESRAERERREQARGQAGPAGPDAGSADAGPPSDDPFWNE
ncbi:MAG: single-stranded DNA-binding protein [Armatimonadota bacterium]